MLCALHYNKLLLLHLVYFLLQDSVYDIADSYTAMLWALDYNKLLLLHLVYLYVGISFGIDKNSEFNRFNI